MLLWLCCLARLFICCGLFLLLLCWEKNKIACSGIKACFFLLLLLLCGLACLFVGAVRSISSVRLLCLALLLLRGLVRLLFYCGLLCCSGLFAVAVVLVLSSLPVLCCYCACVG